MPTTSLWRYLTYEQFEDLIESRTLFFTHRDGISEYEEGEIPSNAEEQYQKWAENCFQSMLMMSRLMGADAIASTYNRENIVQGEMNKTEEFLNNTYFVCFRKDNNYSRDVQQSLNKQIAIKISYIKLQTYWKAIGVHTIDSDIYYTNNRNKINALKRANLLFCLPDDYHPEQEFRILLPLYEDYKIYLYKSHLQNLKEKGILEEDDEDKKLYMPKKEYDMYMKLCKSIEYSEDSHGVKVPITLDAIEEIYIPENKYDEYISKYSELKEKIKIQR